MLDPTSRRSFLGMLSAALIAVVEAPFAIADLLVTRKPAEGNEEFSDGEAHRALEAARIMREHGLHPVIVAGSLPIEKDSRRLYRVASSVRPFWISNGTWTDPVEALICAEVDFISFHS